MARVYDFYSPDSSEGRILKAHGYLTSGKLEKALAMFEALAAEGEPVANEIGYIYECGGDGVTRNLDTARRWYMRAIDETEDDYAYIGLARMALKGYSDAGSPSDAVEYLHKACRANNAVALIMLGAQYHFGETVPKDLHQAAQLYERAREQGYVVALKNLGSLRIEQGHYLSGLLLRLKAVVMAIRLAQKDQSDPRLWGLLSNRQAKLVRELK